MFFQCSTILADSDQPVLRRSKPNSRNVLISEQENPWNLLQLQDTLSRHRGAKLSRQYELSETINLLSPGYFLFVDATLSIQKVAGIYNNLSILLDKYVLQLKLSYTITL